MGCIIRFLKSNAFRLISWGIWSVFIVSFSFMDKTEEHFRLVLFFVFGIVVGILDGKPMQSQKEPQEEHTDTVTVEVGGHHPDAVHGGPQFAAVHE